MQELEDYPSVGFPPIDEDHREIGAALRRLLDAVKDDEAARCLFLAEALIERTFAHFAFEEQLMEKIGYPFFARHKRTHEAFLTEAQRRVEELRANGLTANCLRWCAETMEWFRAHVRTEDMSLARALVAAARPAR